MPRPTLTDCLPGGTAHDPDALYAAFTAWADEQATPLYPHQDEAIVDILSGANVIITTPTGSGKSLIAVGAHFAALANRGRSYYTAPIKALVSEKFFALCDTFGADVVGMVTGDASVNPEAPIVCCTAEILANIALREGRTADVDVVIMDEFHFIADPDRGWAWQVALSELPQCQFVIMSATLGDVTDLTRALSAATTRPTSVIADAVRPVPLVYSWAETFVPDTVERIVADDQAPVYVVHPSQAAATERAQALLSTPLADTERRRAIVAAMGSFRFAPGFGRGTLAKLLRAGVGVHHAGMLPKYRRLVETLAQRGLLVAICGTDTLGVGINVPIRTVLFTSLAKFDGRRSRMLRSREFHQIAGRAGRPGFDAVGYVVAQAPDHEIENARAVAKAGDDPRKLKQLRRKKPPEGTVAWTEASFDKLVASTPETLHARLRITHAMLINLLHRDEDTAVALTHIIDAATDNPGQRRALRRRAVALGRSLLEAGVAVRRDRPTAGGRRYELSEDLQDDFALNQPLSAFAMAALELVDPDSPSYALDVVSVIEATLEDPWPVLSQQQHRARGEAIASMKADGYDYAERMAAIEEIGYPQPLAEPLQAAHVAMAKTRPWLVEHPLSPKSVVRDMYERAMTFAEYCAFYQVNRSEGLVLRYLSDAYRALRQTVPLAARTDEVADIIAWLGEIVRMTDSSLVDEWEALAAGTDRSDPTAHVETERPLTSNTRAFRVLVRNAMFLRIRLAADDDVDALAALDADDPDVAFTAEDWDAALGAYWDEHDSLGDGPEARSPALFVVAEEPRRWRVRQIVDDPERNHDWAITASVDLDRCDEAGELVLHIEGFGRQD